MLGLTAFALSTLLASTSAIILKDLPHSDGLKYTKRGDPLGCLDLSSQENWLWGATDDGESAMGNLTVYMPGQSENLLSMERFSEMLINIECNEDDLALTFKDDETFAYAQKVWDWVNGEDDHAFVMVAGTGQCGWNEHRQPFRVSKLTYNEDANCAHMAAEAVEWKDAIHSYTLNVGGSPPSGLHPTGGLEKRQDFSKDLNIDFNHQLPVDKFPIPGLPEGVTAELDVSECFTAGNFAFQFTLETFLLIPTGAELSVRPQGVTVSINPKLAMSGAITAPATGDLTLARINLAGIQIPGGILDVGPELVISVGTTLNTLEIDDVATLSAGAIFRIPDEAVASVDILGVDFEQNGWTPTVEEIPLTVDADMTANVKTFIKVELELAAKAFSTGFDLGLGIQPYLKADLSLGETAQTAGCNGVNVQNPAVGADLILDAHTPFSSDPAFEVTIANVEIPLPPVCFPVDGLGPVIEPTTPALPVTDPTIPDGSVQNPSPPASAPAVPISSSVTPIASSPAASLSASSPVLASSSFYAMPSSTLSTYVIASSSSSGSSSAYVVPSNSAVVVVSSSSASPSRPEYTPESKPYQGRWSGGYRRRF